MAHAHGDMFFHTNIHNTILFEKWHTMNWEELLGSCIGIAIITALFEGFKVLREHLEFRFSGTNNNLVTPSAGECQCNVEKTSEDSGNSTTAINIGKKKSRPAILSGGHILQTGLHFIQLWISFCLMLVFMTYNVYLCLAVTIGGAIGYFCFAWMRARPSSAVGRSTTYDFDCCH